MPHLGHTEGFDLVKRRHPEWNEHQRRQRWLYDSLEGGTRYIHADYTIDPTAVIGDGSSFAPWYNYGFDPQTSQPYPVSYRQICDRNLIPHQREMGPDGRDLYVMRLAMTPVPNLVERTIEAHLSRIYAKQVTRSGPPDLTTWWADVDGRGSSIDQWMLEVLAPLLLVLGQIDVCFDHPANPPGVKIRNRADALRYGLTDCVVSIILPENLVWWRLDSRGAEYAECLVFERDADGTVYRHWTDSDSNAYDADGRWVQAKSRPHGFGRCPIRRLFDRRKVRCENTGKSRYESIAELQKAIYNAQSELVLSDVQQSHAQLMGPEAYLSNEAQDSGGSIPVGPDRILPMKALLGPNGPTGYQGWEYLDPPKGAQDAIRTHIHDYRDDADRDGGLQKPAGQTTGSTVSQSGVSKIMDQVDGNALLARVADVLAKAERSIAAMALSVLTDGGDTPEAVASIKVAYPKQFDLYTLGDLSNALDALQRLGQTAGILPLTEAELLKRIIAVALPGIDDDTLDELHGEVDDLMAERAAATNAEPTGRDPAQDDEVLSGEAMTQSPSSVLISPTPA